MSNSVKTLLQKEINRLNKELEKADKEYSFAEYNLEQATTVLQIITDELEQFKKASELINESV